MRQGRLLGASICLLFLSAFAAGDPAAATADGLSPDTLIFTVGTRPVVWREFGFWLRYLDNYYKKNGRAMASHGDSGAGPQGRGLQEFYLSTAAAYACNDAAISHEAARLGIQLLDADRAQIAKARRDGIDNYGGYAEYLRVIESMYGSETQYEYLTTIDYLSGYLFDRLYGTDGVKCGDACVSAYVTQEGFMNARYIFFSNRDGTGREISAQRRRKNRGLLRHILDLLDASRTPQTAFAALAVKYGNDMKAADFPEGHLRLLTRGGMGAEFTAAYEELKDHEYSKIVQTGGGDYILLRMPITPDMKVGDTDRTLRYWAAYEYLYKKQISDWCAQLPIRYTDAYRQIDVEKALKDLRP